MGFKVGDRLERDNVEAGDRCGTDGPRGKGGSCGAG